MNRTRLSEYVLLSISAYITIVGVFVIVVPDLQTAEERILVSFLFGLFGLLTGLFFRFENKRGVVHLLIGLSTAVLLSIFVLAGFNLNIGTLFFVLSAYAMLFLPVRPGILWILLFALIIAVQSYFLAGISNLISVIAMGGGFAFFGLVGASLRRSDAARRESDRLLGELQQAHRQLQEYAAQAEQLAVAEERNRLAREMHDALGHRLTVAVVQLEGAQRLIPTEPERAAAMVGTMREQLRTALHELRQTVSALRTSANTPAEKELPLPAAIQRLATNFQTATGLSVEVNLPVELPDLPPAHRLTLFRAVQESLTNVQRHAGATRVWLEMTSDNGLIVLTITDDGKGFPTVFDDGHFGLRGLQERTEQLGGQILFERGRNGGAQVRLQIPAEKERYA